METKTKPINAKMAWPGEKQNEKENIGTLWTDFTQNTGFHGVNKLTPGRNYKFRCLWWTIAVMGMTAYMTYNITKELMNYYKYPTVTSMKVEHLEEMTFPAVTLCNQSPFRMKHVKAADPDLIEYFAKTSTLGPFMGPIDWKTQFLGPTFRESQQIDFWANISMNSDEMFYHCIFKGEVFGPCTKRMTHVATNYGFCATFNFNVSDVQKVRVAGGDSNLVLFANALHDEYVPSGQLSAGFRIILHEPTLHPDAGTSSFLAAPGMTTYVVVTKSSFKYLPPPFKAFPNQTCVETTAPSFNNTLKFFDTYTYEHCIMECLTLKVHETCGCSKPHDHESLQPKCSIFKLTTCSYPKSAQLQQDPEFLKSCHCKLPCTFVTYDAKLSTARYPSNINIAIIEKIFNASKTFMRDNFLELRIYYEKLMVQSTEQVPQYTTETIIGNLGGQMGICLGASILTLTELGEFLIIVFLTIFRKVSNSGEVKNIHPIKS